MTQNKYPRGSEWRKWDLHVHTPKSGMANGYEDNETGWDNYVKSLFTLATERGVAALGITDYFTIEGYEKLIKEYIKKEDKLIELFETQEMVEKVKSILLLPNIEFRLDKMVGQNRVNYHVIFSNKVEIPDIKENFLDEIKFVYESEPFEEDNTRKLTHNNLEELGKKIKAEQPGFEGSDFEIGCRTAVVQDSQIRKVLSAKSDKFKNKYIIAIPVDEDLSKVSWNSQGHQFRKTLYQQCNVFFSSNSSTIEFGLGKKHASKEAFLKEFKSYKPCVIGSDAHSIYALQSKLGCQWTTENDTSRITWIKADPTFDGLKQILYEPENRVYIGDKPKLFKNVDDNRTKYIKALTIQPVEGYSGSHGRWFEHNIIPLNRELVAIIGNKGNGKSAISDILAHCCNYKDQKYFSFLNDDKFRYKKLSDNYTATVMYEDGTTETKGLSDKLDGSEVTRVKYLPQGYFESICNDLQKEENLKAEIESVVFQYIDEASRLGASNFKELIKKKADAIELAIQQQKSKLSLLNKDIVALEDKGYPSYKKRIIAAIEQKEKEIEALIVPQEVPRPNLEDEESKNTINGIARVKEEIVSLNKTIKEFEDEKGSISITLSILNDFIINADGIIRSVIDFKEENKSFVESLGGNIDEIIAVNKDFTTLEIKRAELKKRLEEIDSMISEQSQLENSPVFILKKKQVEFNELKNKLDGPSKAYQTYLQQKEEYETHKKRIEGDETIPNSLNWLKKEKRYIEDILTTDLQGKIAARNHCLKDIYNKRKEIIAIYQQVKSKLDAKIADNKSLLNNYEIRIEASLGLKNSFSDDFLRFVNQSKSGSFRGIESGQSVVQELIKNADLQSEDGIESFCNSFVEKLKMNDEKELYVQDQVEDRQSLYNYLFSLDYLTNNYSIMQGDKDLSVLSPGEKGALLLVFYLLLDMDNIPLILDQPEDNLDNDSVANILVDFIKEAKKKRQIIMVTHNPNLAVVADAEQIVYVTIDKKDGNKVSIESGSIENPNTNKHIVDVLEGAMPAFRKRDDKYIQ